MKLSKFFPEKHPTKEIFRSRDIPISAVAKFLGLSTAYTGSLLNGVARLSPENDRKLIEFARLVESEVKGKQ